MIGDLTVLAIIPARGGSKGIPKKNIKELMGKPLIGYAIDEAHKSRYIDRTIVSTDDLEIKAVAERLGGEVPFIRPSEFATDASKDYEAFRHALEWLRDNEGYTPDIVVQLRPTSPLRTSKHIDDTIDLLVQNPDADSVRTVAEPEQSPYKMYKIGEDGHLEPLLLIEGDKESFNRSRHDLPKAYKHVGYVDTMWYRTIMEKNMMTGSKIVPLVLEKAVSGINNPDDWKLYEFLMQG